MGRSITQPVHHFGGVLNRWLPPRYSFFPYRMGVASLLLLELCVVATWAYIPPVKGSLPSTGNLKVSPVCPPEHMLSEALLREVVEKMGRELEGYLDEPVYPQLRSTDYQENPTVRDHEYLQHSSLWANPFSSSGELNENGNEQGVGKAEGNRQDSLPAYCDPPNPCPLGYTAEEGCLEEFENTAAFSRDYQAGQDCMCDSEHMFDCKATRHTNNDISESELDRLVHHFQVEDGHKNLVAKKFQIKKKWNEKTNGGSNPYLEGERLPVAAKKGINIIN